MSSYITYWYHLFKLFSPSFYSAARQQSESNGYLPPYSTQRPPERPRPFQAPSTPQQPSYSSQNVNEVSSYPGYQQPSSVYTPPSVGYSQSSPSSPAFPSSTFQTPRPSPSYSPPSGLYSSPAYGASSPQGRPSPSFPPPSFPSSSPAPSVGYSYSSNYLPPQTGGYQPSTPQAIPSPGPTGGFGQESSGGSFSSTSSTGFQTSVSQGGTVQESSSGTAFSESEGGYYSPSPSPNPSFPTPTGESGSGNYEEGLNFNRSFEKTKRWITDWRNSLFQEHPSQKLEAPAVAST